jgi:hypothetical protein
VSDEELAELNRAVQALTERKRRTS